MTNEKQVVVRISDDLYEALKQKAAHDERTVTQAVRHAIKLYLQYSAVPTLTFSPASTATPLGGVR